MSIKPTYEQQGVAMTCSSYEEYLRIEGYQEIYTYIEYISLFR